MFSTQLMNVPTQLNMAVTTLAQQERGGPLGPEFGKASPVGLFVIVLLFFAVLFIGWSVNRHLRQMNRRRTYAEKHGLDVFDVAELNARMEQDGEAAAPSKRRSSTKRQ